MIKISQAFQNAIDKNVPRLEVTRHNSDFTAFCADGWLEIQDISVSDYKLFAQLIASEVKPHGPTTEWPVIYANDTCHWTWAKFRDFAKEHGL